jgi:hypothetical protein
MYRIWMELICGDLIHQLSEPVNIICNCRSLTNMEHTAYEYLMLVAAEMSDHSSNKFSPRWPRILMEIGFKPSGGVTNEQG